MTRSKTQQENEDRMMEELDRLRKNLVKASRKKKKKYA
jgi:hypothetical protein